MSSSGHPTFILFLCTSTDYIHIYKANLLTYELDYLSFCFQAIVTRRLRIVLPVLRSSIELFGMYFEYFEHSISFLYLQSTSTLFWTPINVGIKSEKNMFAKMFQLTPSVCRLIFNFSTSSFIVPP